MKVGIAVGGWSDLKNPGFEGLSASASGGENFADNLVELIRKYNLDGVDFFMPRDRPYLCD